MKSVKMDPRRTKKPLGWLMAALLVCSFAVPVAFAEAEAAVEAADGSRFGTPEQKQEVRDRVEDYWKARIGRERRVLEFYAPPEKGGPEGIGQVSEFGNLSYREANIEDIKVGDDWATVTLRVRLSLMVGNVRLPDAAEYATITEQWNRVDQTWYKKPIPPGLATTKPKAPEDVAEKKQDYLTKVKELQDDYSREAANEGADSE